MLEALVWYLSLATSSLVAIKMIATRLVWSYPVLTSYLAFVPIRSLVLMSLYSNDYLYSWAYVITLPLLAILKAWTGLEIYRLVLEAYSGLSVLGRRSLATAVAACGLIAFLTVQMGLRVPNEPYPVLRMFILLDTWVSSMVLFFLMALTGFVLWFPVPLRRNVVLYSFGLCAELTLTSAGYAVRVFAGPEYRAMGSSLIMAADVLIFTVWLFWFTRPGEKMLPEGTIRRSPEDRARLLGQLNSLNAMVRSAKTH